MKENVTKTVTLSHAIINCSRCHTLVATKLVRATITWQKVLVVVSVVTVTVRWRKEGERERDFQVASVMVPLAVPNS